MYLFGLLAAIMSAGAPARAIGTPPMGKTRLLVLTDITSLTAGEAEPDDGQSMVRLMLYSNAFEIEGLIASSNLGHGQRTRPDLIRQVIDAYAQVRPNLLLHSPGYPEAAALHERVKPGQPIAGPKVPVSDSIGEGKDTEASEWIVRVVERPDPRPVWITVWGGTADLAQALHKVRATRSPEAVQAFVSRIRLHSIGDQDSTGAWIKEQFPDLFVITRGFGIRGMYRGGDGSLVSSEWVESHIRNGHGPLGALYPNYRGGDIWSGRLGRVRGIKEGDTPSILALLPNGLNDPRHPELGSWGGRCQGSGKRWEDAVDGDVQAPDDPDRRLSATYRWRPAFQADLQARLDWCVQPFAAANHPPLVRVAGARERTAAPGREIRLNATASTDPDGHRLSFRWSIYPLGWEGRDRAPLAARSPALATAEAARSAIRDAEAPVARFVAPPGDRRTLFPVLLTVTDDGTPPLTRYARVLITVSPAKETP